MILNHQAAIELLVADIEHVGFDRYTVMSLHSALAENLLPNPLVVEELQRLHEGVLARYAGNRRDAAQRPCCSACTRVCWRDTVCGLPSWRRGKPGRRRYDNSPARSSTRTPPYSIRINCRAASVFSAWLTRWRDRPTR